MIKRIFLFLLVNILVITTISAVISVFKIGPYISSYGIDFSSLLIFCFLWGMTGSIISLLLSKKMAKWMMRVKTISPLTQDKEQQLLLETINSLSKDCGLNKTPEIGIYESNEVNAFATGATKNSSLIAVSRGLLNRMEHSDIEAVLAHEISHISNGDMVTMTLLQGIINSFVMFLSRILAYVISGRNGNKNNNSSYFSYYLFTHVFQFIFMIFASIGICAFSRRREFRADKGGAKLAGKEKMINALNTLRVMQEIKDPAQTYNSETINAFKISNFSKKSVHLFATHPPLTERIEKLKNYY
jgi:heat shock protein HtpX